MNSSAIPEGPGTAAGAPHLPEGFTGTFTSQYIDTGDLRQHVVTGGDVAGGGRFGAHGRYFGVAGSTISMSPVATS